MAQQPADSSGKNASFSWAAASDRGKLRSENEDSFFVDPEFALFLVSDGMGGHQGGSLAANIVSEDFPVMVEVGMDKLRSHSPRAVKALFEKTIVEQSKQLLAEGESETGRKGMGATLVITLLKDGRAYIANLGDSRIYRFRNSKLTQLTKDHSVVHELLRKGKIEPQHVEGHEAQGQLTHYVGMEEKVDPHVRSFALKRNDRLLLCTDGLTDMLSDKNIADILKNEPDPQSACRKFIASANNAGGHDNITVVLIDWLRPTK